MILEFLKRLLVEESPSKEPAPNNDVADSYHANMTLVGVIEIMKKQYQFATCQSELLKTLFNEINSLDEIAVIFHKWAERPESINDMDKTRVLQTWDQLAAAHRDSLSTYNELVKTKDRLEETTESFLEMYNQLLKENTNEN